MTETPDLQTLTALARLQGNSDFDRFIQWMAGQREGLSRQCEEQAEGVPLHRAQGATLALRSVLEHVEQAPSLAHKLRQAR